MKLSEKIRPNVNADGWVVDEIKKLEELVKYHSERCAARNLLELTAENESLKRERAMLVAALKDVQFALTSSGRDFIINNALSATEPQATQWLELHDSEVIREYILTKEAGHTHCCVRCGLDYTPPENNEDCPKCGCDSSTAHELRLAASKRKEQI